MIDIMAIFRDLEEDEKELIALRSRTLLDSECIEAHEWIVSLPCFNWTKEEAENLLGGLRMTRSIFLDIPADMKQEAIFFKLKWG